jgi:parallel beta-helix repeat protein
MIGNKYNFGQYMVSSGNHNIDTSNLVDGKPIYYLRKAVNSVYDSSTNAGTFYCFDCVNVTVKDVNLNNNYAGIVFWNTTSSTISNIWTSKNGNGISLYSSSNNTLSANTNSGNDGVGFFLDSSYYNILSGNTANSGHGGINIQSSNNNILSGNNVSKNNNWGIILDTSNNNVLGSNNISYSDDGLVMSYSANNRIYNNFFNNTYANVAFLSYGNYWNTTKTPGTNIIGGLYLGGNVWSNPSGTGFSQTCTDNDKDGICDSSYTLASNNIDYLPLANKLNISDTSAPVLTFTGQTPANGIIINQKWAIIEINANESLQTALLEWNGVNESMSGAEKNWNKRKIVSSS